MSKNIILLPASWISTGKKVLRKLKYWMEQFAANSCSTMEALGCRLRITALPDAVMAAIKASQYATYRIDDADFIETLTGEWYLVELESGKQEVKLRIDATGKILQKPTVIAFRFVRENWTWYPVYRR